MRLATPFGQYVPVDSPVHRLEPRVKIALLAAFVTALFTAGGWAGLAACAGVLAVGVAASRVPPRILLRGVRTVMFLVTFTVAVQAFRWNPATVTLVRVGPLAVDGAGLLRGLFFGVRILVLVVGTSLLTLTTTPVRLTDALERIMRPLRHVRVPVGDIATMLSIALRFIPTTAEEAEKVVMAQASRGARFDRGGPVRRAKAFIPVLVPLFVNLFRRADDLATAMEARCYRGGEGRTRLRESRMRAVDWAVLAVAGVALVSAAVLL